MGDPGCFDERSFQQRPESETTTQKPRPFLLSGGATKFRFITYFCLVSEKTSLATFRLETLPDSLLDTSVASNWDAFRRDLLSA